MDFKKLINKIESIDGPIETPNAPKLADPIRLDEDTELRVLAGVTALTESVIAEKKLTSAEKKKKEEVVKSMKSNKDDFKKRYGERGEEVMHATATKIAKKKAESVDTEEESLSEAEKSSSTWTDKSGKQHSATKVKGGKYGSSSDDKDDDDEMKSKKEKKETNESFRTKFEQMVEAEMKVGDKKKSSTGGTIEKTKTGVKHTAGKKYGGESESDDKKVKESAKPDYLDFDKDGDKKEPMKKALKDKEKKMEEGTKSYSAKAARAGKDIGKPGKNFEKIAKKAGEQYGSKERGEKVAGAVLKKLRAKESVESSKSMVAESVEQKLTFKQMIQLVQESGGQQQIDPLDKELFAWASRVAQNKLGEGIKSELYAGMVYERMGGVFEMYDVLSESHVRYTRQLNEEVDPDDIAHLLEKFRKGEIDYEEFKKEVEGLEYTDYSMRQGEMGNPDMRDQMAWDKEKDEWERIDQDEDENDEDKF